MSFDLLLSTTVLRYSEGVNLVSKKLQKAQLDVYLQSSHRQR